MALLTRPNMQHPHLRVYAFSVGMLEGDGALIGYGLLPRGS